jgi:hypothetical protein
VSSFIGFEEDKAIVEKYDKETLYPMLLQCYHHLHPLFENANVDQKVDEDCSLDNFELTTNTNERMKELVSQKILIFRRFQVDTKISNAFSNGGKNMNLCFLQLDSLPIRS